MRDKKKRQSGGHVSRHAAPEKSARKKRREEEYEPDAIFDEDFIDDSELDLEESEFSADEDSFIDEDTPHNERDNAHDNRDDYSYDEQAADGEFDDEEEAEDEIDYAAREAKRSRTRQLKITLVIIAVIVIVIAAALTAGGYMVTTSAVNFPNVYVGGVSVGSMDKAAAQSAIEQSGWEEKASVPLTVTLMDRTTFDIAQYESGAMLTVEEAVNAAYDYGHTGNWYVNLFEYVKCLMRPIDVNDVSISYDREYIKRRCEEGIALLNEELGDGGYEIDKENSLLVMEKGAGQLSFDTDDMTESVIDTLKAGKTELRYDTLTQEPKMPDFDALHTELEAEPADAYFTDDNTFTVVDDVEGCDFDVSKAESIWTSAKNAATVEIPIKLTFPEVTGEYLRSLLYRDKLGSMTTYFPHSNENRISNIKLACSKIEGLILYPGDVFSYNDTLGQRTEEAGFKMAGAYSNGEVVEELGGGICQVSSTLYSATLYAYQVNTVQRYPHYFPVDYMEKGYDATVSWPKPDYQFRNDREYPIKIVTHCDENERSLTVEIWGTNLDGTYIELTKDTYSYNSTKYPWIMEGYGVQMHRNVFDANGIQIDRVDEVYDVYHTHEATEQIKMLDAQAAAEAAANGGAPA